MIKQSKKAFSMITAIFVIVIMATVTSLIMNVTGKTIKETTQQYQKEQAMLLARSYTEQALFYALHYDRQGNGSCLNDINSTFGDGVTSQIYTIETKLSYISNSTQLPLVIPSTCNIIERWQDNGTSGFNATVSVIIDVYVHYQDLDDALNRPITYHRRSLQKL